MKKLLIRTIPVLIFCTALAANWLALIPGSTLNAFAMPPGFGNSKMVLPDFRQDHNPGFCANSDDFPTAVKVTPKGGEKGGVHYRILTINNGNNGQRCDHLQWDIHSAVPQAAMKPCKFLLHLPGVDSKAGIGIKFTDFEGTVINNKTYTQQSPNDLLVKGLRGAHIVRADFSGDAKGTPIDIGTVLFVDCDPADTSPAA
jgi:hypothetical protein